MAKKLKIDQQLLESVSNQIIIGFGRFNPPTIGHQLLIEFIKRYANQQHIPYKIYVTATQDKKKNPLPQNRKLYYLNMMFPNTNFVGTSPTERTIIEVLKELNKTYSNIILVAGSDRVAEFQKLISSRNGKDYEYTTINVMSAGERDPDSDSASGMSATKMREAAKNGDFESFKSGIPSSMKQIDAKKLMNEVREGLGVGPVKESINGITDIREKYYRGKLFHNGQLIETKNEDVFQIIKCGTNHIIVKDIFGNRSSRWLYEVQPLSEATSFSILNDKNKFAAMVANLLEVDVDKNDSPDDIINKSINSLKNKKLTDDLESIAKQIISHSKKIGIQIDRKNIPLNLQTSVTEEIDLDRLFDLIPIIDQYKNRENNSYLNNEVCNLPISLKSKALIPINGQLRRTNLSYNLESINSAEEYHMMKQSRGMQKLIEHYITILMGEN